MRERGKAGVRPPSGVIVAAVYQATIHSDTANIGTDVLSATTQRRQRNPRPRWPGMRLRRPFYKSHGDGSRISACADLHLSERSTLLVFVLRVHGAHDHVYINVSGRLLSWSTLGGRWRTTTEDNGGISWGGKRTLRTLLPTNVQNIQYNGNGRHGIRIRSSNQPRLRYHFQRLYRVVHLQGWISIILGRSKGQANENLNTVISNPSLPIGGECKSMRRVDQWWTSKRGVTLNSS